jgi:hypothetical protein
MSAVDHRVRLQDIEILAERQDRSPSVGSATTCLNHVNVAR